MCQKSSRDIIKKLHRNHLTNGQNAIAEKKLECPVESNCQVNDVIYKYDVTRPLSKKVFLGLAEGEWKLLFKKKRHPPTRQHFQVTYCTGKVFQVKHIT